MIMWFAVETFVYHDQISYRLLPFHISCCIATCERNWMYHFYEKVIWSTITQSFDWKPHNCMILLSVVKLVWKAPRHTHLSSDIHFGFTVKFGSCIIICLLQYMKGHLTIPNPLTQWQVGVILFIVRHVNPVMENISVMYFEFGILMEFTYISYIRMKIMEYYRLCSFSIIVRK